MKQSMFFGGCVLVISVFAMASVVKSGEGANEGKMPDEKAMQEAGAKAAALGPQHARFKETVGVWNTELKHWSGPGEPKISQGVARFGLILGGRYLEERYRGEAMGRPFEGRGYTGYDNATQKYVMTWMDNMSTGILVMEGHYDETGKIFTGVGETNMPGMGKTKMRTVSRDVNKNKTVMEMYIVGPDGNEMKTMEITYTRQ